LKKITALIFIFLLILHSVSFADNTNTEINSEEMKLERGEVTDVVTDVKDSEINTGEYLDIQSQVVKVKVLTGKYKGEKFIIDNGLSGNMFYDIKVKKGDKVILGINEFKGHAPEVVITDFTRDTYIMYILIAFILLLLIVGRLKGIKSLITLLVTGAAIFKVLLPLILRGYSPIWVTVLTTTIVTIITFLIIGGFNIKSASAIIGTVSGVVIAGALAYIVGNAAKLTGLNSEEGMMLMHIPQKINFDFQGLLFAGIIIGTLGAVMDVSMSISSSMYEMRTLHPEVSPKELMKSGLNVGKDVMGTMSNTLILAYTGSSLPLLLLFMAYETSLVKVLNMNLIATEIVRAFVGSIGLIIAIPITTLATGLILKLSKK